MSALVPMLRAIVREELGAQRLFELGVVTQVLTNEGGSGDNNVEVNVRVRGSALELQKVPVAVGRLGLSVAPRVDDLAVLAFVGGDLNGAVVVGFLYDEQTRPPDAKASEIVYVVPDDAQDGVARLEIQLPNSRKVRVEDSKVEITMGGTTVTIEADGAITLQADGDLNLKAKGAINIEAQGDATVKGQSVSVEGQSSATLKGSTTTIAGTTNFSPS